MRHGIILYAGREGSSAILAHLRRHPGVVVPLFEQLDTYVLEREVRRADWEHLPLALQRVLRGGQYAPAVFAPASAGLPAADAAGRRTLFKWRGWQLDAAVAEALAAEGAGLFLLNRRDLLNQFLSFYFTRHVIGGGTLRHPQFEMLAMGREQRAAFRGALQAQRFRVEITPLADEMREQLAGKRRVLEEVRGIAARGVTPVPLWYEDFLAAPEPFLAGMLSALGLPWHDAVRRCEYEKASRGDLREQVENRRYLEGSSEIRALLATWAEIAAGYAALAPGGMPPDLRTGGACP